MRSKTYLSLAAGALAFALLLPAGNSEATPLSGAEALGTSAGSIGSIQEARTVCQRVWVRHRGWRTRCYWVPDRRHWRYRHYRHYRRW